MGKIRWWIWLVACLVWLPANAGWSAQAEWRDGSYDFGKPLMILVMDTTFSYEGYNVSGRDKFNKYPFAKEKTADLLNGKLGALTRHRIVNMDYVVNQIKGDATRTEEFDPRAPGFQAMINKEMGKHIDLLLYLEVRDYGWFYQYHDPYVTTETVTERVQYSGVTPEGKTYSGWMDVPRTVVKHHPAGYFISDIADAYLRLVDAKSGKDVWKYSDNRVRRSPAISNGYDPSGPESMMNRIFNDAFKKIPLNVQE